MISMEGVGKNIDCSDWTR